jgi:catechol 2,3-dioxygenase-like lactoylglutathione lyase family enzyme
LSHAAPFGLPRDPLFFSVEAHLMMLSKWNLCRRYAATALAALAVALTAAEAIALEASFHHVHLNASDPPAAAQWYAKNMGGEATKVGPFSAVGFGKVKILFFKSKEGTPGSVGSAVDHIGFSYKDIDAKMKELADSQVEIVSGVQQEGPIKYAFVKDPWGTLIEIVQDPEIMGFHHAHLATTDPQATLKWYTDAFGGQVTRFAGLIPGVRYGDVWVLVKKVEKTPAPTKGRAIDHLSWGFADLDAAAVELKAKGVKFNSGPYAFGTGKIAFVEDPLGVLIELVGPASKKP